MKAKVIGAMVAVVLAGSMGRDGWASSWTTLIAPGANNTYAYDINNAGVIVGYCDLAPDFKSTGYVRDTSGGYDFLRVPGADYEASGINNLGQVVGWGPDGISYLRDPDGTFTLFGVPGALSTSAQGINDLGQIVGDYHDADGETHAFLRNGDGSFITFDYPGPDCNTHAYGINNAGQIVGSYATPGNATRGFFRSATGDYSLIEVLGAQSTWALNLNNNGQIVGRCDFGTTQGFFLDADGTYTIFSILGAGWGGSHPNGINDLGQIVGEYMAPSGFVLGYVGTVSPGEPDPGVIPEPLTAMSALLGLSMIGGYIRKRRLA